MKATKYRIKPTEEQQQKLAVQFGCARFVYNDALAKKQAAYKEDKTTRNKDLTELDQSLTVLKEAVLNFDNFIDNEKRNLQGLSK